jgi:hypothetical protein
MAGSGGGAVGARSRAAAPKHPPPRNGKAAVAARPVGDDVPAPSRPLLAAPSSGSRPKPAPRPGAPRPRKKGKKR